MTPYLPAPPTLRGGRGERMFHTQHLGLLMGCRIFLTDRCYCTYVYTIHNSPLLAKLHPSLTTGWGKYHSPKSRHITHLFRHNNRGKYKNIRELGEGSSSFFSSPVLPHHFIPPPPGTARVAREGRGERGDGGQTSFPPLLFICLFLSHPLPPGEYMCSNCRWEEGGRGGKWDLVISHNNLWGLLLFTNERGGDCSSSPSPPHFCTKSPLLAWGEGEKEEKGIPQYDIWGDLCTTLIGKGKINFIFLPFFFFLFHSALSLLSTATAFLPPRTGFVCPFVARGEGRRGGRGKGISSFLLNLFFPS